MCVLLVLPQMGLTDIKLHELGVEDDPFVTIQALQAAIEQMKQQHERYEQRMEQREKESAQIIELLRTEIVFLKEENAELKKVIARRSV